MDIPVIKVAYVGTVDEFTMNLFRYQYMGQSILNFKTPMSSLLGADFSYYRAENGTNFQIWEINNDEKFNLVKSKYYHGSSAGIITFSLNDIESVMNLTEVVKEIFDNNGIGSVPIAFLGIKDIYTKPDDSVITEYNNQVKSLIELYGRKLQIAFFETSIQYGENRTEVFSFFDYAFENQSGSRFDDYCENSKIFPIILLDDPKYGQEIGIKSYNTELQTSENHLSKAKCVADRSIIELDEESDLHLCSSCNNYFCDVCYEFYLNNRYQTCPGTNSKYKAHNPIFV